MTTFKKTARYTLWVLITYCASLLAASSFQAEISPELPDLKSIHYYLFWATAVFIGLQGILYSLRDGEISAVMIPFAVGVTTAVFLGVYVYPNLVLDVMAWYGHSVLVMYALATALLIMMLIGIITTASFIRKQ